MDAGCLTNTHAQARALLQGGRRNAVLLPHRAALAAGGGRAARTPRHCRHHQRRSGGADLRVKAVGVVTEPKKATKKPQYTTVDLPALSKDFVPKSAKLPDGAFGVERKADAIVLEPQGVAKGAAVPAVIFCHGFSQPPTNYLSTLQKFTEQGWLVIAPTTSLFDVLGDIETVGKRGKPPAKLQTALILDALRSAQYLKQVQKDYKIQDLLVCGHSMGGAGALVVASKLKGMVKGVGVMAPAVKQTVKTDVNPGIAMSGAKGKAAAITFFSEDYPVEAPLHILGGKRDVVVGKKEVQGLYNAAYDGNKTGDLKLYWLPGSHIGFEDGVDLEFNGIFLQKILFAVINFLLYRAEVTKLVTGDYSDQRMLAQDVLVRSFTAALAGAGVDDTIERGSEEVTVAKKPSKQDIAELEAAAAVVPSEGPWVLPTILLLSYAGMHAYTFSEVLSLFTSSGSQLSTFSAVGLGAVVAIAAGLVYENLVLAAGRFITDSGTKNLELLDSLNDPRFLFHSGAPVLAITALDLGQRLGVGWTSNPWVEGGVTAAVAGIVALSTLRNTLLLQTKPTWSAGIFHYTFDDPGFDFTRIIPVAALTVLLTAVGASATLDNPANWPLLAGPAVCLALSAGLIPRKVAPMIITGNAGEALMLLSLAVTEAGLLGQQLLLQ